MPRILSRASYTLPLRLACKCDKAVRFLDKHLTPNLIAAALVAASYGIAGATGEALRQIGLFALSGALTNWLAVHMLFERVPGLYGSGVIPARFETFKGSLEDLIIRQLFNKDSVEQVLQGSDSDGDGDGDGESDGIGSQLDLEPALIELDLDAAFEQLIEVIKTSSFGGMLGMLGGVSALEPLREPFKKRMRDYLQRFVESPGFQRVLRSQLASLQSSDSFIDNIRSVVRRRLDELTPEMVKDIVKQMIKEHLGWLVVWGAVFGGLIGLLTFLLL